LSIDVSGRTSPRQGRPHHHTTTTKRGGRPPPPEEISFARIHAPATTTTEADLTVSLVGGMVVVVDLTVKCEYLVVGR
jgi:hypothetical protein